VSERWHLVVQQAISGGDLGLPRESHGLRNDEQSAPDNASPSSAVVLSLVGSDNVADRGNSVRKESTMAAKAKVERKQCTRCKKRKAVDQFYRDRSMKSGLTSWCKTCTREYDRAYAARKKAES
jgi:hypothetical protein